MRDTFDDFAERFQKILKTKTNSKRKRWFNTKRNSNLHKAKTVKNDEFYTRLEDIENELRHYKDHFRGKTVYCNCDDPKVSNFFTYFSLNFEHLGLKKLITSCYRNVDAGKQTDGLSEKAVWLEYTGEQGDGTVPKDTSIGVHEFEGDGDFRSAESIELLKQADIVVTNPPFSLFREYVGQLIEYKKQFLIIGNMNALTYKEIFPLLKDNKMWLGLSPRSMTFETPGGGEKLVNACWFTNLDHDKRHDDVLLFRGYNENEYPKYDNYDAIEVSKVVNIPVDYDGVMGVPITFLDKYNPEQFVILGATESEGKGFAGDLFIKEIGVAQPLVEGKRKYKRIFIKHKKPEVRTSHKSLERK